MKIFTQTLNPSETVHAPAWADSFLVRRGSAPISLNLSLFLSLSPFGAARVSTCVCMRVCGSRRFFFISDLCNGMCMVFITRGSPKADYPCKSGSPVIRSQQNHQKLIYVQPGLPHAAINNQSNDRRSDRPLVLDYPARFLSQQLEF